MESIYLIAFNLQVSIDYLVENKNTNLRSSKIETSRIKELDI